MKPRLLDLFCGAGGASMGYHRAGFAPYGIDNKPQSHYPFPFLQMDALEVMDRLLRGEGLTFSNGETLYLSDFVAYHASPPCEKYSVCVHPSKDWRKLQQRNPDLIDVTRQRLLAVGKPFVIENVPRAPLQNYIKLDGTQVGLKTIKERWFELHGFDILLLPSKWNARGKVKTGEFVGIMRHGKDTKERTKREHLATGYEIDWGVDREGLRQAIPPAYTEYIGKYLMKALNE